MTNEDWLAALEAEERRKDEAGAKAAQELADKQKRHLNKKVREDPTYPTICVHRTTRLTLLIVTTAWWTVKYHRHSWLSQLMYPLTLN